MNKANENFIQKLISVIDKVAPFKTKRVKVNSQKWFDGEVLESIALRYQKFKISKLNVDKEIHDKARDKLPRLTFFKKESTSKTN